MLAFSCDVLGEFELPQFLPKNITEIIQVVDRHIGIQYKLVIYKIFRIEMMKWLQEARKGTRKVDGITLQLMSPPEKRNFIAKVVAECHERLLQSIACKRAFYATSTWLPFAHLKVNESSATKDQYYAPKDIDVKLQHLPDYKYIEQCPKNKVLE